MTSLTKLIGCCASPMSVNFLRMPDKTWNAEVRTADTSSLQSAKATGAMLRATSSAENKSSNNTSCLQQQYDMMQLAELVAS